MRQDFKKYKEKGDVHWQEAFSYSPFKFNAYLNARYKMVFNFLGDIKGKTVVDMGAGDCALTSLMAEKGAKVIAVDNSKEGLEYGKDNFEKKKLKGEFLVADIYNMPLASASANIVVSSDVIEHLDDPEKLLKEASRILKTGGQIIISTPYRISEKPSDLYHTHEFYPNELKSLIEKYFTNIKIKESHHIFWFSLYNFKYPITKRPLFKYLINSFVLLTGRNPFLRDDSKRGKRDYYTQITLSAFLK
jgi:ubiquinone/menaquinone biosynthesis C-methylase UbiE